MSNPRILVGVDFSPESVLAARQALDIARHVGGKLVLVHVSFPLEPTTFVDLPEVSGRALEQYRAHRREQADQDRERLDEMRRTLTSDDVPVLESVVDGYPDTGLALAARELAADLLIVGTHGRGRLRWFHLGSVSQRMIRLSELDVLVARGEAAASGGFDRIFVTTDFSSSSARALDRARWLASPGGQIDVVHFYQLPRTSRPHGAVHVTGGSELDREMAQHVTAAGHRFIGERSGEGPVIRFHAVAEPPIPGILHWLERQPYDLVALGSHGRRGFRRLVLGSVAEAVARRAPCSTLVAHARAAKGDAP